MTMGVSFRPQVTVAPTPVQQAKAGECKEELKQVETDVKNNQITDIAAMTKKMQIESQLNDTKAEPVKYVEEVKPQPELNSSAKVADSKTVDTPNTVTDVIKNFHNGRQYSKAENSQMLMNQMNQFAVSNRILHGLF